MYHTPKIYLSSFKTTLQQSYKQQSLELIYSHLIQFDFGFETVQNHLTKIKNILKLLRVVAK